jgi:hypothetical protein
VKAPNDSLPELATVPKHFRWLGRLLMALIVGRNRWRLLKAERRRVPEIESAIELFYEQAVKYRRDGWAHRARLANVSLFILVLERDIAEYKVEMVSSLERWRLRLTARNVALLLYEMSEDLPELLGKEFRESIEFFDLPQPLLDELTGLRRDLNKWAQANRALLKTQIRDICAGHRETDAVVLLDAINSINPMDVFRISGEFYDVLRRLINWLIQVTTHIRDLKVMLKEIREHGIPN